MNKAIVSFLMVFLMATTIVIYQNCDSSLPPSDTNERLSMTKNKIRFTNAPQIDLPSNTLQGSGTCSFTSEDDDAGHLTWTVAMTSCPVCTPYTFIEKNGCDDGTFSHARPLPLSIHADSAQDTYTVKVALTNSTAKSPIQHTLNAVITGSPTPPGPTPPGPTPPGPTPPGPTPPGPTPPGPTPPGPTPPGPTPPGPTPPGPTTPSITKNLPTAQLTAIAGSNIPMNITVSGSGSYRYQWFVNGAPVSGATKNNLRLNPIQLTDAGRYHVVVTLPNGKTLTSKARPIKVVEYRWVNTTDSKTTKYSHINKNHRQVCEADNSSIATEDQGYGICASGENRPRQGTNYLRISYKFGTSGANQRGGNTIATYSYDVSCNKAGCTTGQGYACWYNQVINGRQHNQRRDNDKTDRVVAYLCRRVQTP